MRTFFVILMSVLLVLTMISCENEKFSPTEPTVNVLDEVTQGNAFSLYEASQISTLKNLRNNPGLSQDFTLTDSIPPGQVANTADTVSLNESGWSELKFRGIRIFKNSWDPSYMGVVKEKTYAHIGSSNNFTVVNFRNYSRIDDSTRLFEKKVWFHDKSKVLKNIDLSKIAAANNYVGFIGDISFYKDGYIFIDIYNGHPHNQGPHELVLYSLLSGNFKKFTFPE